MPRLCHVTFKLHSHRPPASAVGAAIRNHFGLLDGFLTETCPPFGGISPASLESGLLKSPGSGRQMMALVPRLCDWITRSFFCWILMNLDLASKTHPHLGHPWVLHLFFFLAQNEGGLGQWHQSRYLGPEKLDRRSHIRQLHSQKFQLHHFCPSAVKDLQTLWTVAKWEILYDLRDSLRHSVILAK